LSLRIVSYRAHSELPVSAGRSDNSYLTHERLEQSGCVENQWDATEIEKSLVAAHARAGAACKNEAGDLAVALHGRPAILRPRVELAQRSGGL
jgi:hypothetical protein